MKRIIYSVLLVAFAFNLQNCAKLAPGYEDESWKEKEYEAEVEFPYLKDSYEATYDVPFETVFNTVVESIEDINCMIITKNPEQNPETGLYTGKIISDYCIFSVGDTTAKVLEYYSTEVPFIRGGNWINGRVQYDFTLNEQEDGTTHILLQGQISGFEKHVTNKVHFWQSNGYYETKMMERIDAKLK